MLCHLPVELLRQIYYHLFPVDFDAARHTCKWWFSASLDRKLLTAQLYRGGWKLGAEQDLVEALQHYERQLNMTTKGEKARTASSAQLQLGDELVLSRRLAAETRLCPRWKAASDTTKSSRASQTLDRGISLRYVELPGPKLAHLIGPRPSDRIAHMTVSGCGEFGLLIQDRVLFVYRLYPFKMGVKPATSILCHRPILKASMDTSSGRFAVAILLEGRTGVCCDMDMTRSENSSGEQMHASMSLSDFRHMHVQSASHRHSDVPAHDTVDFDLSPPTRCRMSPEAATYRRRGHPLGRTIDSSCDEDQIMEPTEPHRSGRLLQEFNSPISNAASNQFYPESVQDRSESEVRLRAPTITVHDPLTGSSVGIERGVRRIYKNLCTVHNPPQSVAICPQRQCVAFGCRNGVELHWIDTLRGNSISRWFPLAAPSDFLYFLRPPENDLSAKTSKLHLISSAAGPEETVHVDHYRAVPLGLGFVLFTDPEDGHVYIGHDRPGTTSKLSREVECQPPKAYEAGSTQINHSLHATAGRDTRWGLRILVAYGPYIMLYSVEPDYLHRHHHQPRYLSPDKSRTSHPCAFLRQSPDLVTDENMDGDAVYQVGNHDADAGDNDPEDKVHHQPRRLEGIHIASITQGTLSDMAIDSSHGNVKVSLFLHHGAG